MWLRNTVLIAAAALVAGLASWAQTAAPRTGGPAQGAGEGLPSGSMQAKATTACLECHDARIILQQRLSKAGWTREVDKMMKWGALVEASDREPLIDYLNVNFGVDQAPYQPTRLAPAKPKGQKSQRDARSSKATQP